MGPRKRSGRRSEEVAKAVGGGCCRFQMSPKLVGDSSTRHRIRTIHIPYSPHLFQCAPGRGERETETTALSQHQRDCSSFFVLFCVPAPGLSPLDPSVCRGGTGLLSPMCCLVPHCVCVCVCVCVSVCRPQCRGIAWDGTTKRTLHRSLFCERRRWRRH